MTTREIWRHHPGYADALVKVRGQSQADDLQLLDTLFGRDGLPFGATPEQVKAEALRQLEIEGRCARNDTAEFWANVGDAQRKAARP
jgi:hypothetical protein